MARKGPLWSSFSIHNVLFTGQDPFERDLDDATFLRSATKLGPDSRRWEIRPKDTLRGPLWRVWLARMLFIWPPPILFLYGVTLTVRGMAGLWVLWLPLFWWWALLAAAVFIFGRRAWRWWNVREERDEVIEPTAIAVADVLDYRYSRRKAAEVVQLPDDWNIEGADAPEDIEYQPVKIALPKGGMASKLQPQLLGRVSQTLKVGANPDAKWTLNGGTPHVLISRAKYPPGEVLWDDILPELESNRDPNKAVMGLDSN